MLEINAFISAQYTDSSLKMQLNYTLSSCSYNFLHPENTFNSNLSSDVLFPDWNSVSSLLSASSSLQSFQLPLVGLCPCCYFLKYGVKRHAQCILFECVCVFCIGEHDVFYFISNAPLWLYIELWCLFFLIKRYIGIAWDWSFYLRVCHLLNIVSVWLLILISFKVVQYHQKS